jgi:cell division protein FtsB
MPDQVRSVSRAVSAGAKQRQRRALGQRLMPTLALLVGVVGTPVLLVSTGGLGRLDRLRAEQKTVEVEISRIGKRIEQLQARSAALKSDSDAVERAARDELGLVRRTEVVFQFQDAPPAARP